MYKEYLNAQGSSSFTEQPTRPCDEPECLEALKKQREQWGDKILTRRQIRILRNRPWNRKKSPVILCERCKKKHAKPNERYCRPYSYDVIKELEDCGYLQQLGHEHCGMDRTEEMKQELTSPIKSNIAAVSDCVRKW